VFREPNETSPLARSGSRYPGKWLWGVESNHQPARVVRSQNPRQHGILALSWALGGDRCGENVADGGRAARSSSPPASKRWRASEEAREMHRGTLQLLRQKSPHPIWESRKHGCKRDDSASADSKPNPPAELPTKCPRRP